jgi:hypothetical protein
VLPRASARDPCNKSGFVPPYRDFSFLFDRAHLRAVAAAACPQMRIHDDLDDLRGEPYFHELDSEAHHRPHTIIEQLHGTWWMLDPAAWRAAFDGYLAERVPPFNASSPYLMVVDPMLLAYNVLADSPQVVRTLGRFLQPPAHIVQTADAVLRSLDDRFELGLDADGAIVPGTFYGAHVRTESDAAAVGMAGYEAQAAAYIEDAVGAGLHVLYAASNNEYDLARLRNDSAARGISVVTKYDLLRLDELERLRALNFDQAGIVDYLVLLRASRTGGIITSSFSYNVAIKRAATLLRGAAWAEGQAEFESRPWWAGEGGQGQAKQSGGGDGGGDGGGLQTSDALSMLLGSSDETLFAMALWP